MTTIRDAIEIAINVDGARARKEFEAVGTSARKNLGATEDRAKQLAGQFKAVGVGMAVTAGVIGTALLSTIGPASDLNESASKSKTIFKEAAKEIDRYATNASKIGLSKQAALEATATFGGLFQNIGKTAGESAVMSQKMVDLAADMASFNNASPEETLLAIQSGLRGEAEPLRRFNVLLDDATLRQEAMRQGLIRTTSEALTPQQKTLAAYGVILGQTAVQQGDFARTSEGLANKQRVLKADVENAKAAIGTALLPVVSEAVGVVGDLAGAFTSLSPEMQGAIGKFAGFATLGLGAAGTLSFLAGKAIELRNTLAPLGADGARSLTKVGKAAVGLGAAGAAIGLVSVAMELFGDNTDESTNALEGWTSAVQAGSSVGQVAKSQVVEMLGAHSELRDALDASGISQNEFLRAVQGDESAMGKVAQAIVKYADAQGLTSDKTKTLLRTYADLRDNYEKTKSSTEEAKKAQRNLANEQGDATSAVDLTTASLGRYSDAASTAAASVTEASSKAQTSAQSKITELVATKGITAAMADEIVARRTALDGTVDYVGAAEDAAKAADKQKSSVSGLTAKWDRNTDALQKNIDAQQKVRDAQRDSITSVLDLEDAVADVTQKQKDYDAVLADHAKNSPEALQAERELKRAVIEMYGAVDTAAQSQIDAAAAASGYVIGQDNSRGAAQRFRDQLKTLQDQFPQLRGEIQAYIDKLNTIPDSHNTVLTINGQPAQMSADGTVRIPGVNGSNSVQVRARGGPVKAGSPYVVGEEGPELFVPGASGSIVPNNKLSTPRSTSGAYGDSGGSVVVNMHVSVSNPDPNAVVAALDRAFAKNGARILRRWALSA